MSRWEAKARLRPDWRGILWDLLLYVPTVGFLLLFGLRFWFSGGDDQWLAYPLLFLATFFFLAGAHRVAHRLLLAPGAPVAIDINRERVKLSLKSGDTVALVRDVRFYPDYAGRSFGLSGLDGTGERRQFVIHRAQLGEDWDRIVRALERFRA
ncbi:MAG: hypothetical protein D6771_00040 [Zetaproteobacteria bacterium]|nr:MAG: hypothetical protein D6771_00040 [Zetaproteobacteria bacterium]